MGCLIWLIKKTFLVTAVLFLFGTLMGLFSPTEISGQAERPSRKAIKMSLYIPSRDMPTDGGVNCMYPCDITSSGESIYDWEWTPDVDKFGIACAPHLPFYTEIYFHEWDQVGVCIDRGGAIQDYGSWMWVDVLVSDDHDHLLPFKFGDTTTAWNFAGGNPASKAMGGLYDEAKVTAAHIHGDPSFPDFMGVDVSGGCGAPIYAPFNGIVTTVGVETGWVGPYATLDDPYNTYIEIISADGRDTLFMYHGEYTVKPLQTVAKGDLLGYEANRGNSTGCHSHVVLRRNGVVVNYLDHAAEFGGTPDAAQTPSESSLLAGLVDSIRSTVGVSQ